MLANVAHAPNKLYWQNYYTCYLTAILVECLMKQNELYLCFFKKIIIWNYFQLADMKIKPNMDACRWEDCFLSGNISKKHNEKKHPLVFKYCRNSKYKTFVCVRIYIWIYLGCSLVCHVLNESCYAQWFCEGFSFYALKWTSFGVFCVHIIYSLWTGVLHDNVLITIVWLWNTVTVSIWL